MHAGQQPDRRCARNLRREQTHTRQQLIDAGSVAALAYSGSQSNLNNQYNIAGNTSGLAPGPTNIAGVPAYINSAQGDYRLRYSRQAGVVTQSLGIDYAPPVSGDDRVLHNASYDQDLPGATDLFGIRDLGAYEMQPYSDRLFADPFGDVLMLAY